MKKGFTLIELLAVIVILAIIALIATPIILGIINDARDESNERSVELYASAVRNGIAAHQLRTGEEVLPGTYNETKPLPFEVDYEGKVECTSVVISDNGKVLLEGCKVNGGEKEYSYGTSQDETPDNGSTQPTRYYSWTSSGSIGGDLPSDAKVNVSELDTNVYGYPVYLGLDVDTNNKVTAVYVCITRNENEYCLKGYDTEAYATNQTVLEDAFADVLDDACSFDDDKSLCSFEDPTWWYVVAFSDGKTSGMIGDAARCTVKTDGNFNCDSY